eukprot:765122-Hanusia_phi.AAC.3
MIRSRVKSESPGDPPLSEILGSGEHGPIGARRARPAASDRTPAVRYCRATRPGWHHVPSASHDHARATSPGPGTVLALAVPGPGPL